MFDFGDTLTHTPADDPAVDPYQYIQGVNFRGIAAFGANGSGDFLRACKTFEINVDETVGRL